MNFALIMKFADAVLCEHPKGRGRKANVARGTLLMVCGLILWHVRDLPEKITTIDNRVARIEWRLNVTDQAVTGPGGVTPAASRFPLPGGEGQGEGVSNQFAFTHK
jgi:hypothetical protein